MWDIFLQRIKLDWLQIEVSSHCNGSCIYCPQTAYNKVWIKRLLFLKQIERISTFLHPKTYIHLQGWGEPFTHPQLLEIIKIFKEKGFKVGTTSNGSLLTVECMEKLVDIGLDLIAFSIAECTPERNDLLRKGTSLRQVVICIDTLNELKIKKKSAYPKIHLAQILMRSSLPYIDSYPFFWKSLGVDQIVLSSLSLITKPKLQIEAQLADSKEEWSELKQKLYEIRSSAKLQNILHFHLVSPFVVFPRCSENIEKSAVLGSGGDIASCVMANLPINRPVTYWAHGQSVEKSNVHWGNIQQQNLRTIWKNKAYKKFRNQKENKEARCVTCLKRCIETIDEEYQTDFSLVPDIG